MFQKITSLLLGFCLVVFIPFAQSTEFLQLDIDTRKGKGTIVIKLLPEAAPEHVKRIKLLTEQGAYNNVAFHRVIPGFMAQTGDVKYGVKDKYNEQMVGKGKSSNRDLYAELSEIQFQRGIVGMARDRYIHSANSQFFNMMEYHPHLNGRYTGFGIVTAGHDYLKKIKAGRQDKEQGKVTKPDFIRSAKIIKK
jgi:cyclophilin family peptidyl-prolyl cis-trans isomerase